MVNKLLYQGFLLYFFFMGQVMAFELPMEAESFELVDGWLVTDYGYFPAQPNVWSLNKIVADETDKVAIAHKDIIVPESKTYSLWVRYESCYGFGSVFKVKIVQNGKIKDESTFGRKEDKKYFPFGRGYAVQMPWDWHNTDYVYQGMNVLLEKGKARVIISKDGNDSPPAKRVVDLLYLTDDLSLKPGDDWDWSWLSKTEAPILSRFKTPVYLKAKVTKGEGLLQVDTKFFLIGYYKGPKDTYYFSKYGLSSVFSPLGKRLLKEGDEIGWQKIEVSSVMPPVLSFSQDGSVSISLEIAVNSPENIVKELSIGPEQRSRTFYTLGVAGGALEEKKVEVLVGIGKEKYEREILGDNKALTFEEIYQKQISLLENYQIESKPAQNIFLSGAIRDYPELAFKLALSCGLNGESYGCRPEIYGVDPKWKGFNTSVGFITLQNQHLIRECYERNFVNLEKDYKKEAERLKESLSRELPQNIKLIEESGPPPVETLLNWPKVKEKFKEYLSEQGLKIEEVDADKDIFHYQSNRFRNYLFAKTCAQATKIVEKYFPPGTITNSGSFFPSIGGFPTFAKGYDPFLIFCERGVTAFSSEVSWGMNTPDYVGPQTQSYEAALARALSKYYSVPMNSYLICDGSRGYTGDFVELSSYALFSQGFTRLNYYDFGWPSECCFLGYPDILKAIKRVSYSLWKIEDDLLGARVVPAKIAIGWSSSTDVWDIAEPETAKNMPGNCVYPQERHNLYLLLRHLQYPVDILSEEDLSTGYLQNYTVFFLIGDHLRPEAAESLKKWVGDGGILISVAGGGLFDHYNKPLDTLKPVFGIEGAVLKKEVTALRPKLELVQGRSLDTIIFTSPEFSEFKMDVYGYRQSLQAKDGRVLGIYKNEEPAVIEHSYGKGRALIMGALPGAAYLKSAIPLLPYGRGGEKELSNFIPTDYSREIAKLFRLILKDIESPVYCSNPLVEANLLETRDRYVIPLVNHSNKIVKSLKVTLNLSQLGKIKSVQGSFNPIKQEESDKSKMRIEVPYLDKFEVLVLKRN